jgi:hypothetical protein
VAPRPEHRRRRSSSARRSAGPQVRSVAVAVGGRARTLPIVDGAFLGVLRGDVAPKDLPFTVRYRAGRASVFRVEAGPLGRVEER